AGGDGYDDAGGGGRRGGEARAEGEPRLEHGAAEDLAVGPREVDVLEDALAHGLGREGAEGPLARALDDHELAGLELPHELRADEVEGAGLGGHDGGAVELADHEGAEAP